ncbi:MAG TPA: thioredoxin family protein [Thermoanaerobaculia bacterium]|nr:thioredoxin family protein [Thermoanaerobaculia bacterium]
MICLLAALLWQSDWNSAFAQAKQQHKLVLVDYDKAPCPACFDIEQLARDEPELGRALGDFVLLRVDLARTAVPPAVRYEPPAYVVFDTGGRERLRIHDDHGVLRADDWHFAESRPKVQHFDPHAPQHGSVDETGVIDPIVRVHAAAPAFVQASELLDAGHNLDANFLIANAYARLKMTEHARAAYAAAKKIAERAGNAAAAQSAEVQSAYTYVSEGHPAHAVELLKPLSKAPVNRDAEALIWLTLGRAYEAATDKSEALDAYRRAQTLAAAGSRTEAEASASLKRLQ